MHLCFSPHTHTHTQPPPTSTHSALQKLLAACTVLCGVLTLQGETGTFVSVIQMVSRGLDLHADLVSPVLVGQLQVTGSEVLLSFLDHDHHLVESGPGRTDDRVGHFTHGYLCMEDRSTVRHGLVVVLNSDMVCVL